MTENQIQIKILELAAKRGWDATRLTDEQYRRLSFLARDGIAGKVEAAASAGASLARTKLFGLTVLPEKSKQNEAICRTNECGSFGINGGDNTPRCEACGCSGNLLRSKWSDPTEECPRGKWSNNAASS